MMTPPLNSPTRDAEGYLFVIGQQLSMPHTQHTLMAQVVERTALEGGAREYVLLSPAGVRYTYAEEALYARTPMRAEATRSALASRMLEDAADKARLP